MRRPCGGVEVHHLATGRVLAWEHRDETLARQVRRAEDIAAECAAADQLFRGGPPGGEPGPAAGPAGAPAGGAARAPPGGPREPGARGFSPPPPSPVRGGGVPGPPPPRERASRAPPAARP